ncbi:MAG TPA: hypothetical protein VHB21_00205 [Minicystis sp.]|nr:hypothetical protein [Minicystis sp.]
MPRLRRCFAVLLLAGSIVGPLGCAPPPAGPKAVSLAVRAETWDARRSAWLNAHCVVVRTDESTDPTVHFGDDINYRVMVADAIIGMGTIDYACPEDPPWPHANPTVLAEAFDRIRQGQGFACPAARLPPDAKVEVVAPGSGEPPSPDAFAAVRIRLVHVETGASVHEPDRVFHGRVVHKPLSFGEREDATVAGNYAAGTPGPASGTSLDVDGPAVLKVDHVTCLDRAWLGAVSKLRPGGRARVTRTHPVSARGAASATWEIELVGTGREDLMRKHFGL